MSNIAIVSALLSRAGGGPAQVVEAHVRELSKTHSISVYGATPVDIELGPALVQQFRLSFPARWFYCQGLKAALRERERQIDLVHAHMLWDYPVLAASQFALKPLIITPHGSIAAPWRARKIHKRIYRELFLKKIFKRLSYLHVFNEAEAAGAKEFGLPCQIWTIPNGLPRADFVRVRSPSQALESYPVLRDKRIFLYLGRLWGEKGLDMLPEAFSCMCAEASDNDSLLVIAGPDYRDYKKGLLDRIRRLPRAAQIQVLPPVSGALKDALLEIACCVVLPSRGEGFSMTILEAMSASKPVILSRGCNMPEIAQLGAGIEINYDRIELTQALLIMSSMTDGERAIMGLKGNRLGLDKYTLEQVGLSLTAMYAAAIEPSLPASRVTPIAAS